MIEAFEGLKFAASAGVVFTALTALLWFAARKTEALMRDDVKTGFAAWLKSAPRTTPLRDWCYAFTHVYDAIFKIESRGGRLGAPGISRVAVFAIACVTLIFIAFGRVQPALAALDRALHHNEFTAKFPEFFRTVIADLTLMLVIVLLLCVAGVYASVFKTRLVLAKFPSLGGFKRVLYVLVDLGLSLLIVAMVLQASNIFREISNNFVTYNLFSKIKHMPYEPPGDPKIFPLVVDIYFQFLSPLTLSALVPVLVPIGWTVLFAFASFAAKGAMHVETLRRPALAHLSLEKHPLLVTSRCLIATFCLMYWAPVLLYAAYVR